MEAAARIDILVNNAGCNVRKPAVDVTWDDWNLVLDTNLRGTFFVAQAVAPATMIPQPLRPHHQHRLGHLASPATPASAPTARAAAASSN